MIGGDELTPQLIQSLRKEGIVVAYNLKEAREKSKEVNGGSDLESAATEITNLIRRWKGGDGDWIELKNRSVLDLASGFCVGKR